MRSDTYHVLSIDKISNSCTSPLHSLIHLVKSGMMQNPDSEKCIETQATVSSEPHVDLKRSLDGIILIPQPTDDPLDPLDWPQWKKLMTLIVVSIASSTGYAQATANQSGYFQQAAVYGKTATEISYGVRMDIFP